MHRRSGNDGEINEAIYRHRTYHASYEPMRSIRPTRWSYLKRFDDFGHTVLPNCDDGPAKEVWLAHGWRDVAPPNEELYDLIFDPNEVNNLARDSAHVDVRNDLAHRLTIWQESTNDPILSGAIPLPDGARVNPQDGSTAQSPPMTKGT